MTKRRESKNLKVIKKKFAYNLIQEKVIFSYELEKREYFFRMTQEQPYFSFKKKKSNLI
jgi:hypothetical protein